MPKGMHKLPDLRFLTRRLDRYSASSISEGTSDGMDHGGYIDFMESGFSDETAAAVCKSAGS